MSEAIVLFPGQGAQSVGMGKELVTEYEAAQTVFALADETLGMKISDLCFAGPEEDLVRSENAQPAVTTLNLAALAVLKQHGLRPVAAAGHSLGEYAALVAAEVLDVETAIRLTRRRGELMQACADKRPGSMAAVIGLDMAGVSAACEEAARDTGGIVAVANYNSPTQVVVTGEHKPVARAAELARARGAKRIVELNVAGPWHSILMNEAREAFGPELDAADFRDAAIPVYTNVEAGPETSADALREALKEQITSPVRWAQAVLEMRKDFPRACFVECGPGRVLKGLMRGIDKAAECRSVECPKSLTACLESLGG